MHLSTHKLNREIAGRAAYRASIGTAQLLVYLHAAQRTALNTEPSIQPSVLRAVAQRRSNARYGN